MTKMLLLPQLLKDAGVHVRVLPNWDKPHIIARRPYLYRTDDGEPVGSMHHHTTGKTGYTQTREQA